MNRRAVVQENESQVKVLGGMVPHLVENWRLQRERMNTIPTKASGYPKFERFDPKKKHSAPGSAASKAEQDKSKAKKGQDGGSGAKPAVRADVAPAFEDSVFTARPFALPLQEEEMEGHTERSGAAAPFASRGGFADRGRGGDDRGRSRGRGRGGGGRGGGGRRRGRGGDPGDDGDEDDDDDDHRNGGGVMTLEEYRQLQFAVDW